MTPKNQEPVFPKQGFIAPVADDAPPDTQSFFIPPSAGLSKRELFAAMAMQGALSTGMLDAESTAQDAVACADALLEALAKEGT